MRFICFLFLLVFSGAVATFAWFNQQEVTLRFLDWSITAHLTTVLGAVFVLGMLSGWTIVGILRRSVYRVTEPSREYAHSHG
jgi:uncharacterized membrane protein YciS (DUF1049 family)